MEALIFYLMASFFLVFAAWEDYKTKTISPELNTAFVTVALTLVFIKWILGEITFITVLSHLSGVLALFGCGYLLMKAGMWGGGDVKLFAGIGAALGLYAGLAVVFTAIVIVGAFVLAYLIGNLTVGNDLKKVVKERLAFAPFLLAAFMILITRGWI